MMKIIKTPIEGVVVLQPDVHGDQRGYFMETYRQTAIEEAVGEVHFVQENESKSSYGVLRGLHYQLGDHSQAKLVRVVCGSVLDVAVDIRRGSPTFGRYVAVELSEDNQLQLFIPKGFAHGFVTLSHEAVFAYKCDEYYCPESEAAILCLDPALGIDWGIKAEDIVMSLKDQHAPLLMNAKVFDYVEMTGENKPTQSEI